MNESTERVIRCSSPAEHYRLDGELFDYSQPPDIYSGEFWRRLRAAAVAFMPIGKNERILDVGSGAGWVARELSIRGARVTSLDLSYLNLRKIKDETGQPAIVASGINLPFSDSTLDYVIASEVIEHLNDPASAIREFFRVIKPGGRVVITTPYKEVIRYYLCIYCNRMTPANAHLHSFTEDKLVGMFSNAGASTIYYRRIGNKAMIGLRVYYLLRFLPYPLWSITDRIANVFIPRTSNIVVCGIK